MVVLRHCYYAEIEIEIEIGVLIRYDLELMLN